VMIGKFAMNEQVRDFFKFTSGCEIQNIVTTIVQIIPAAAHGA